MEMNLNPGIIILNEYWEVYSYILDWIKSSHYMYKLELAQERLVAKLIFTKVENVLLNK